MLELKGEEVNPLGRLHSSLAHHMYSGLWFAHAHLSAISSSTAEGCQAVTPSCLPLGSLVEPWAGLQVEGM